MKENCYIYLKHRTKNGKSRNLNIKRKKEELSLKFGSQCSFCNKYEKLEYLELDHKIPFGLSGDLIDIENLQLLCIKCHRNKSVVDRKIIKMATENGWVYMESGIRYIRKLKRNWDINRTEA